MKEIWRPIRHYEGLYEVSNFGRIKALERTDRLGRKWETRILKLKREKTGYLTVHLSKDGVAKTMLVHRIVAEAFINNTLNLPCVNHKDENKGNNFVDNLEWCTSIYNNNYGTSNYRQARTKGRKVAQYTKTGLFVCDYYSISEAARRTGFSIGSICGGLNTGKLVHDYFWKDTKEVKIYA